jgi:DNA-binding NtrC family response regulator
MSVILVVDDERAIGIAIRRLLTGLGHEVDTATSAEEAFAQIGMRTYHLVVTDLSLGTASGLDVLQAVKARSPETAVVVITAYGSERVAVEAMTRGAADYVPKPFDNDELELVVARALDSVHLRRDLKLLQEQMSGAYAFENIVGKGPAMQRVFDVVRKVADTDLTVLIRGASGTGKELVANAIHWRSPRRNKPFVKVNCAAFARDLVESELFGHEKGAFTGATSGREGKFEVAHGGTLLLDEIGDMPLETQAKILRVLQEKEFERVGGNRPLTVDVRILAATNQDLEARVRDGRFREDLYYRLNVVGVALPTLGERPEDLPLLIERFLASASERMRRPARALAPSAYRALVAHPWPGNVRELEHAIEQAVALASGPEIVVDDLPAALRPGSPSPAVDETPTTFRDAKQKLVEEFERRYIGEALARHRGNISKAADEMGMYRQQLQQKLADYGIDAESYRGREDVTGR